jgi:hypothetical protein
MPLRGFMTSIKIEKWHLLRFALIVSGVVAFCFFLSNHDREVKNIGNSAISSYNPWVGSSKSLWGNYFETPFSEVRNFKGKAVGWMGYSNSFRFQSDAPIKLKEREKYESIDPSEIISHFTSRFPEDVAILNDKENLTGLFKKKNDERILPKFGEYFLHHKKTNTYFLWSHWGH